MAARRLVDDIFEQTGLYFTIVEHEFEGFYLEQALSPEYMLRILHFVLNLSSEKFLLCLAE